MLHRRETFPGAPDEEFSSTSLTGGGGIGFRWLIGARLAVTPEVRIGGEPITRVTIALGYRF